MEGRGGAGGGGGKGSERAKKRTRGEQRAEHAVTVVRCGGGAGPQPLI